MTTLDRPRAARRPMRPTRQSVPARVGETADSLYLALWLSAQARRHRLLLDTVAAAAPRRASA